MFFDGSVAEAIAASRGQRCPLIVLLTGFDQDSREVQDQLMEQEQQAFVQQSLVMVLEDDLENQDHSQFTDAKNFRAFCPVDHLPTVVMLSPAGRTLAQVAGVAAEGELRRQLAAGFDFFSQLQSRQERLSAAHALSTDGGAAPSQPADTSGDGPTQSAASVAQPADDAEVAGAAAGAAGAAGGAAATEQAQGGAGAAEPVAPETAAAAQQEEQQAVAASVALSLQFKFTDCSVLRGEFSEDSSLAAVFGWIDRQRAAAGTCRGLAYMLVQAIPRVVLGAAHEGQSLVQAGVKHRASLQVIPHSAQGHRPPQPPPRKPAPAPAAAAKPLANGAEQLANGAEQQAGQQQQQQGTAAATKAGSLAAEAATASPADVRSQLQEVRLAAAAAAAAAAVPAAAGQRSRRRLAPALRDEPPPPPPTEIQVQVRLTNGLLLRRTFPSESQLSHVLSWVDEERTDRGVYKLVQRFPKWVTYYDDDLNKSLLELGFHARTSLQLMPFGAKAKPTVKPSHTAAKAGASPLGSFQLSPAQLAQAEAQQQAEAAEAAHPPGTFFTIQFKLTNGERLRAWFPWESSLREVCHHLDTHRTDGGQRYELVQPFPRRRFSPEDLPRSLRSLGLPQRCLLLLEPLEAPSWSLRGTLAAAAGFMNPVRFLRGSAAGTAGTAGNQPPALPAFQARERQRGVATETLPAGGSRQQQRGVRKRGGANNGSGDSRDGGCGRGDSGGGSSSSRGGGMNGNVHTLGSYRDDAPDGPQNRYSNGNSTSYEARPPPDDQQ
ncbi:Plant UBX domain-containing protein 11 [Chlorella vulgaris]